jgi:hypothetical protein
VPLALARLGYLHYIPENPHKYGDHPAGLRGNLLLSNTNSFAAQVSVEDCLIMGNMTIFDYARMAAQAELRIVELFDGALRGSLADDAEKDLPDRAPRQGKESSG